MEELRYWHNFVKTDRFIDGWASPWKNPELQQSVHDFIIKNLPTDEKLLDVGSGVVSLIHGSIPDYQLVAADLLAKEYEKIFDYNLYRINPPLAVGVEDLQYEEKFQIVHISNALDHSQDPVKGFNQLQQATKPQGFVIIQGFEDEAEFESYIGFHQWNISIDNKNHFIIRNKEKKVVLERTNPYYLEQLILETGKSWFIWIEQKL